MPKKRGAPSGFNGKVRETFLRLLKEGKTLEQIAEIVGVSKRTLYNWQGKNLDLLHAVRESKQTADELIEASLYHRALGYSHPEEKVVVTKQGDVIPYTVEKQYPPDTTAAMFWLRNRQPKKWREKNEGDVTVNNNLSVEKLSDEQLEGRISAMLAIAEKSGKK